MRLTLIFDEQDVSITTAAIVVEEYRHNNTNTNIEGVDGKLYIVRHTKGTSTYIIVSADSIKEHFKKEKNK